jgi:tyrosyl-tRNA synthetase
MSQILGNLYIGDTHDARSLKDRSKWIVVTCAIELTDIDHDLKLDLYDGEQKISIDEVIQLYNNTADFIQDALSRSVNVLVHCVAGVSRSPSVVLFYLMKYKKLSFGGALELVTTVRPLVNINKYFVSLLKQVDDIINATDENIIKKNLITRNLQEVIGEHHILKILSKRPFKIYWGTAPTGRVHIGYFTPLLKILDFLKAGCEVTILLADLHAVLDNLKSTAELVNFRTDYYETIIKLILKRLGGDLTLLKFVRGKSFQLTPDYTLAMYTAHTMLSIHGAKHAGADVVKQSDDPMMAGLLYPTLQALDEVYLGVDAQLGGIDQRKIFVHAREILPKINLTGAKVHLMNPMVPALSKIKCEAGKMSASDTSKIDILDSMTDIKKKVNSAYCLEGDLDGNTPILLVKHMVFPILAEFNQGLVIKRADKYGGDITYNTFTELETDFTTKQLHPGDLKKAIVDFLQSLLKPIQEEFAVISGDLLKKAYP